MSPAMASRLALVAGLLLSTSCSAVSLARAGPEHADPFGVSPLGRSGGAQAGAAARASCEDAQPRSACFNAVTWLRQEGFNKHPEWYPDYGRSSTFREVQDLLSRLGKSGCPRPCLSEQGALEASEVIELEDGGRQVPSRSHLLAVPTAGCHDAAEGEWCHKSIAWLKAKGLERHPDWYPNLSRRSSSYEIQAVLHAQGKSDCPKPCEGRPEPEQTPYAVPKETPSEAESSGECADARPDTRCYTAVAYGLAEGLAAHPDFYPGLRATATFKQVQERRRARAEPEGHSCAGSSLSDGAIAQPEWVQLESLYLQDRFGCERPCPEPAWRAPRGPAPLTEQGAAPTRVQDMSEDQLNNYLDGDWDGVQSTSFNVPRADLGTSTFPKAPPRSTTTTPEPAAEEADRAMDREPLPELEAPSATAEELGLVDFEPLPTLLEAEEPGKGSVAFDAVGEEGNGSALEEQSAPASQEPPTGSAAGEEQSGPASEEPPQGSAAGAGPQPSGAAEEEAPLAAASEADATASPEEARAAAEAAAVAAEAAAVAEAADGELREPPRGEAAKRDPEAAPADDALRDAAATEAAAALGEVAAAETPEEMERRIRAEVTAAYEAAPEPRQAQAVAPETPDEMESRIRAEVAAADEASRQAGTAAPEPQQTGAAAEETREEVERRVQSQLQHVLASPP